LSKQVLEKYDLAAQCERRERDSNNCSGYVAREVAGLEEEMPGTSHRGDSSGYCSGRRTIVRIVSPEEARPRQTRSDPDTSSGSVDLQRACTPNPNNLSVYVPSKLNPDPIPCKNGDNPVQALGGL